jgi:hypothetical protein
MRLPRKNSASAVSRVEVLVIVTVAGFLLCLGLLWLRDAKTRARSICCNCNLMQIGLSFRVWAGDHKEKYPMQVSTTNGGVRELILTGDVFPAFQIMSNELNAPIILVCPEDSKRFPAKSFATNFDDSKISYFVGSDASDSMPQMFLAGDRNLSTNGVPIRHCILELTTNQIAGWTQEIHINQGNVGMADGSTQRFSNRALNEALQNTGVATNRLAIP